MYRNHSRFICFTTAAALVFSCILFIGHLYAAGGEYLEDINADGKVNIVDVISLLMLARDDPGNISADYDDDGLCTMNDVTCLLTNIMRGELTSIKGVYEITGTVVGQDSVGLAGIRAILEGGIGGVMTTITVSTDSTGRYKFEQIPLGSYEITFSKGGNIFQPFELQITVSPLYGTGYRVRMDTVMAAPLIGPTIDVVAKGFVEPESPTFDSTGNLYVGNYQKRGDIARITPQGEVSVFLDQDIDPSLLPQWGMAFSKDKNSLIVCDVRNARIISIDMQSLAVTVLVDNYNGTSLQGTKDLVLMENGDIYFTDPIIVFDLDGSIYSLGGGGNVYVYSQALEEIYLLAKNFLGPPTGIAVTQDRKTLYVAQAGRLSTSFELDNCIFAFPLSDDGYSAGEALALFKMPDVGGRNGPVEIVLDSEGNLYVSHWAANRIYKVSPQGRLLAAIQGIGTNVAGMEIHGDSLYITDQSNKRVLRTGLDQFGL